MVAYLDEVKNISMKIKDFNNGQFPKEENKKADALANLASAFDFISDRNIPLEFLPNPSIEVVKTVCQAEASPSGWMTLLHTSEMELFLQTSSKLAKSNTDLLDFSFFMEFCTKGHSQDHFNGVSNQKK